LARAEDTEDPGDFALHLVWHADRGCFRNRRMRDCGGLELRGADPLAGDVERVVGPSVQEPVTVRVDRRPVAVRPHAREPAPVRVEVALVVAPDTARHAGPRSLAHELADLAAHWPALRVEDVHVLPESREAERNLLDRLGDAGREKARPHFRSARL